MVVLHKMFADARFRHRFFVVTLQEKTAGIMENPGSRISTPVSLVSVTFMAGTIAELSSEHPFPEQLLQVHAITVALHRRMPSPPVAARVMYP